jgi:uncharacterized membrane protein
MRKSTYDIVLRETYILLIYSHRIMKKTTTMMLAIMSAIIATGLAVSPTLATPVFAQSASTSSSATDFGSAASSASGSFAFGDSSASSGAGEDVTCDAGAGFSFCDARR